MTKLYANIDSNVVTNIVVADDAWAEVNPAYINVDASVAIGDTYADGVFSHPTQSQPTFDINTKWEAIKKERDRRILESGYLVSDKWFHSDSISRTQQLGLVIMGASLPQGIMWKTMDGSFVEMTQTLAQQILAAAAASDLAIFTAAEVHKANLYASATPAAYDIKVNWPYTPYA